LKGLAEPVGPAHVGHEVAGGASLDEVPELEAGVVVLAGGDGNVDPARDLGARGQIVGEHRLLVPDQVQLFQHARLAEVAEHVQLLVDVDHHADPVADRLLHGQDALPVHAGIRVVDLHLVEAAAARPGSGGWPSYALADLIGEAQAYVYAATPWRLIPRSARYMRSQSRSTISGS